MTVGTGDLSLCQRPEFVSWVLVLTKTVFDAIILPVESRLRGRGIEG